MTHPTSKEKTPHPCEWLIRKRGYYYRAHRAGYTASPHDAGRYTEAEAKAEAAIEPWHMSAVHISQALPGYESQDEKPSAASNERCPHGISLTAYPPCHFCEHQRLREAAIAACSAMGCFCVGDREDIAPENRCEICKLGALLSGDGPVHETTTAQHRESGWLVENGKSAPKAEYRSMDESGIHWTADINKALRFARRADAEAFASGDEDAWCIAEHVWCEAPARLEEGHCFQKHPTEPLRCSLGRGHRGDHVSSHDGKIVQWSAQETTERQLTDAENDAMDRDIMAAIKRDEKASEQKCRRSGLSEDAAGTGPVNAEAEARLSRREVTAQKASAPLLEPGPDLACEGFVPDPHSRFCDRCGYPQREHKRAPNGLANATISNKGE